MCRPTASALVVKVAVVPLSGTVTGLLLSIWNCADPVGVPAPGAGMLRVADGG